tara:strand:- start:7727 stop:8695 length:969 start_codon:yes stop_codon:yes gene_type:complete
MKGRSIRLFLVDGTPTGIISAEIMNWTGHILYSPRASLAALLKRDETERTGVYVLIGENPSGDDSPKIYIGETENIRRRLYRHNSDLDRDFWDHVCVVTSKDNNLTKSHIRYLEAKFIWIAEKVGRSIFENQTRPEYKLLPESDISDMDYFIEQVKTVFPVIGLNIFKQKPELKVLHEDCGNEINSKEISKEIAKEDLLNTSLADIHVFELRGAGVLARATLIDGEWVVHQSSTAKFVGNSPSSYSLLQDTLLKKGILVPAAEPSLLEFVESYAFKSPSAAASVIMGTSRNGRTSWKVLGTGQTYAEWEESQMPEIDQAGDD